MKNVKKWITRVLHSKTMIFNAVGASAITLEASLGILAPLLPVNAFAAISVILAVGNAALRVVTKVPLSEK